MNRKIVSILLTSEPNYDQFAFKYFLLSLNRVQKNYEFMFPDIHNYYYSNEYYDSHALFSSFEKEVKPKIKEYSESEPDYSINIVTSSFGKNLFSQCRKNVAFITTDIWEKYFSPPSLFEYLFHSVIACLLFMNRSIELHGHKHTIKGCCLDYVFFKENDRVDIALGYICDECKEKIINGMNEEYLDEMMRILGREWIGNVNELGSVAYSLKHFFKFDINKDSGFNKTFWERVKDSLYEMPKEIIVGGIIAIISVILGLFLGQYIGK